MGNSNPKFLAPLLLLLVGCRVSTDGIRLTSNFYEVDPGKYYRSAQLDYDELNEVIKKYKIKTILNLQGSRPGFKWYDDEERATKENGVKLINMALNKDVLIKRNDLLHLFDSLEHSERPILVHCRSGSDRTGLATALYEMEFMGKTREEALESLSFKYLHLRLLTPAQFYFMDLFKGLEWAKNEFNHCLPGYRYAEKNDCPKLLETWDESSTL